MRSNAEFLLGFVGPYGYDRPAQQVHERLSLLPLALAHELAADLQTAPGIDERRLAGGLVKARLCGREGFVSQDLAVFFARGSGSTEGFTRGRDEQLVVFRSD